MASSAQDAASAQAKQGKIFFPILLLPAPPTQA
jgi:hypothetical protein